jgi:hypothetical protein
MRKIDTMRWRGARFAVLLSLAAVVVSCTGSSPSPPAVRPTPSSSLSGSPPSSPRPGAGKAFEDGYAVWPQDTFQAADGAPSEAWRDDPNAVAAEFASKVLGWTDARIKTLRFGIRTANVQAIEPGVEPLDVDLRSAPPDTWSVLNVMPHGEYLPSVDVQGARASVSVELDGDAVSAEVTVGYDGKDHTVTTHRDGTVHVDLGKKPRTSGHFLILTRDSHGDVVAATGSTLPAGDFAAS